MHRQHALLLFVELLSLRCFVFEQVLNDILTIKLFSEHVALLKQLEDFRLQVLAHFCQCGRGILMTLGFLNDLLDSLETTCLLDPCHNFSHFLRIISLYIKSSQFKY